jgi:hypothetical protein
MCPRSVEVSAAMGRRNGFAAMPTNCSKNFWRYPATPTPPEIESPQKITPSMRSITFALSTPMLKVARGRDIISVQQERPSPRLRHLLSHYRCSRRAPATCLGVSILMVMGANPAPRQVGSFNLLVHVQ